MRLEQTLYKTLSLFAPVGVAGFLYAFATHDYRLAWMFAVLVVLAMEGRVQVGTRLPRTWVFWVHILSAVPFLFLLTALAFVAQPQWVVYAAAAFFTVMIVPGAVLWRRGMRRSNGLSR